MKRGIALLIPLVCACSPLEGPGFQQPLPYGGITVHVGIDGPHVDHAGSDSIFVALDSAIQGYGLLPILANGDSAAFNPVLVGIHETSLRGVNLSCSVASTTDPALFVSGGEWSIVVSVLSGVRTNVYVDVHCPAGILRPGPAALRSRQARLR